GKTSGDPLHAEPVPNPVLARPPRVWTGLPAAKPRSAGRQAPVCRPPSPGLPATKPRSTGPCAHAIWPGGPVRPTICLAQPERSTPGSTNPAALRILTTAADQTTRPLIRPRSSTGPTIRAGDRAHPQRPPSSHPPTEPSERLLRGDLARVKNAARDP